MGRALVTESDGNDGRVTTTAIARLVEGVSVVPWHDPKGITSDDVRMPFEIKTSFTFPASY